MTLVCETECDVCHPKRNSRCRGPVQVEISPLLAYLMTTKSRFYLTSVQL